MGLETATHVADLNSSWPLGTDQKSTADDHIRLIKSVLQNDLTIGSFTGTLTGMTGSVTGTFYWSVAGKLVTLYTGNSNIQGTSNATSMKLTGIPAGITPATRQKVACSALINNGSGDCAGHVFLNTDNTADILLLDVTTGTYTKSFTASGTKGINGNFSITFSL